MNNYVPPTVEQLMQKPLSIDEANQMAAYYRARPPAVTNASNAGGASSSAQGAAIAGRLGGAVSGPFAAGYGRHLGSQVFGSDAAATPVAQAISPESYMNAFDAAITGGDSLLPSAVAGGEGLAMTPAVEGAGAYMNAFNTALEGSGAMLPSAAEGATVAPSSGLATAGAYIIPAATAYGVANFFTRTGKPTRQRNRDSFRRFAEDRGVFDPNQIVPHELDLEGQGTAEDILALDPLSQVLADEMPLGINRPDVEVLRRNSGGGPKYYETDEWKNNLANKKTDAAREDITGMLVNRVQQMRANGEPVDVASIYNSMGYTPEQLEQSITEIFNKGRIDERRRDTYGQSLNRLYPSYEFLFDPESDEEIF